MSVECNTKQRGAGVADSTFKFMTTPFLMYILQHWGAYKMYIIIKFVLGSLELDSVFLIEGSILDPCYEIWE
jgi:hypothetical protein